MERREKRYVDPYFMSQIDDLTTRSFVDGLPFEYRIQMGPEARISHTEAFAAAKKIAKRRELDKQRETERHDIRYRSDRERIHERDPRQLTNTRRSKTPLAYQSMPRSTHQDVAARQINTQNSSPPAARPNNNNMHESYQTRRDTQRPAPTKQCHYCKRLGHDISECRRREFNNSNNNNKFQREGQGNFPRPSESRDAAPVDNSKKSRPMKTINVEEKITGNATSNNFIKPRRVHTIAYYTGIGNRTSKAY
ncbi:hypothetical protein ALC62_00167 [Cyphomyrmex costatus]|uniref:CCHC-type domain-containing protein n=1 Tax=Cyphomyrmex costatus TaxID=456900 RepID=A0A151K1Z5_9HYME|nr:hypothetical protein ALC62_00167 [Cyphomyrmex costatus]